MFTPGPPRRLLKKKKKKLSGQGGVNHSLDPRSVSVTCHAMTWRAPVACALDGVASTGYVTRWLTSWQAMFTWPYLRKAAEAEAAATAKSKAKGAWWGGAG